MSSPRSPKSSHNDNKLNVSTTGFSSYTRPLFYSPSRSLSFLKHYQQLYPFTSSSPVRDLTLQDSVRTKYVIPYRSPYRSPLRESLQNSIRESTDDILRTSTLGRFSPSRSREFQRDYSSLSPGRLRSSELSEERNSPYRTLEEETFLAFLKEIILLENEIERVKCELALKPDFNFPDAYRVFESDRRGKDYLDEIDVKYGLNFLDVFPVIDEIHLVFKRFSSYANSSLR